MAELYLSISKKIDVDRKLRLEEVRSEYPDLFLPGGPPEEQLLELAPFLLDRPQKFYHEITYESVLAYLTHYYSLAQHGSDMIAHFSYVADELRRGTLNTDYYSHEVEQKSAQVVQLERKARVLGYWRPWYLSLVEDCLKNVCSPLVWAVSQSRGNTARLEDLNSMRMRADILNTLPQLRIISKDFNATIRNGCAHDGITLLRNDWLLFDDRGKPVRWTDDEFLRRIEGLLDTCNALVLATRVFVFRNWSYLSGIFEYQSLPEEERERPFRSVASTPIIDIKSARLESLPHGRQVTIEATDKAIAYEELVLDALAVLHSANRFYPEADWVFLGLKGPNHLSSWVRVPMPALHDWLSGATSIEQFLQTPDVDLMIFQFKRLPLARKIASLRRGVAHSLPKSRIQFRLGMEALGRQWRIVEVHDKSTGLAKRLEAPVIIPKDVARPDIEHMLIEATDYVRKKLYRTRQIPGYKRRYRVMMANRPAGYVWLQVFSKEKRSQDMWPDPTAPYYVCRTEWFDEKLRATGLKPVLNLPDQVSSSSIAVEWNQ